MNPNLPPLLKDKKIALGVCGSIAIYKSIEILRNLQKLGAKVRIVMSDKSQDFIRPLLFETLSNYEVLCSQTQKWSQSPNNHIEIASWADLFLIAPCTANSINKIAYGIADNILLESFLAFDKTKLIAPAANTKMLENHATLESLEILKQRGISIINPQSKELACKQIGNGALAEPLEITYQVIRAFYQKDFWQDRQIGISSGGSREKIDSVRYLSNYSSGKMGASLALASYFLGANVTYIGSLLPYTLPLAIQTIHTETSQDFLQSIQKWQNSSTSNKRPFLFMSAAISDYIPKNPLNYKLKKEQIGKDWNLALKKNIDILQSLSPKQYTIGFKLESQNGIQNATKALQEKHLDAICLNEITQDFTPLNSQKNHIVWIDKTGKKDLGECDKFSLALKILQEAENL
ncbi:bifunctional phosphopantothenoylcysteine decarboxylase/phosphopantothenate--cysteine ligase CoaBC [Helicobacter pullorum]|uniref:bifunctional phosphopantothenoylcysteine decarboxylase/phosphopantothenate--cysteine ligase CoaBC n=1 Tax=Helicobacter pullorum TaxID=35818 RepID=UPI0008169081|nr:bifunctional phosphopantothenoylcysteine decarboxylase/phosphopantothenate--cysteine ligase CoaBC [Helicobacter pullorum]KAB0575210.1 bifunctional phosphopantothenoylcysteine decarboxylase/phosphopantothenate--cysteine ligase CoaBC [Helicobacter pullorum NCTC 12824]OCR14550.1 Clp protease ClpB [Helicobacter pullorum]